MFVNVILSVVDMMTVGKAGSIGYKTIGLYLLTTVCASILGILSTLAIKPLYEQGDFADPGPAYVQLGCSGSDSMSYVTEGEDGSLMCSAMMDGDDTMMQQFVIEDVSGTFLKKTSGPASDISLSDTVYDGVFRKLVTSNIVDSF